ncbi:hypothetical protein FHX44_112131 [Pseudonocardia hierapolitana]|uniref:Uncharacterized protein n=1 Tax=Pseudonocardia hierapolitana TaxID=1128676 RepID=A0A561SN07_9PSEU|nr:hypothetical protein [Pseudonocardia hierapolitana]TWF76242.1 hypothetical protein FHX44_112131 [Pseudonocardia hierapolitana]
MADHSWDSCYLYRRHSPRQLRDWVTRLRWFRFCSAFGAHNNDGDDLRLALRAETEHELAAVLAALGITELGHVRIAGENAYVWSRLGRLELRLSDPDQPYEVTARTVESAIRIEAALGTLTSSVIDPPLDDPHCVCPKYHPHLWSR